MNFPPKNKTETAKLPEVSLEKAKELAAKWEHAVGRFSMADKMMAEIYKQYPQLDNRKTPNAYEAYQADQKGLADVAGNAANALSPSNLAKALQKPEQEPEPVVAPLPVVAEAPIPKVEPTEPVEPVEPAEVVESSATVAAPAKKSFIGSLVAEPNPEPTQPPQVSKAQEIAKKIKEHPFKMTAEDWAFKNDPKNAKIINEALMEGASSPLIDKENLISPGKKSLDRSRGDYTDAVFQNSDIKETKDIPSWERDRILKAQSEYDENHLNEYQKIYREQGPDVAMKFAMDEKNKKTKELLVQQNGKDWKNIKDGVGTVVGATAGLAAVGVAGVAGLAKFGYDRGTKAYQNVDWNKTYDKLKKKFNEKPKTWKETLNKWVGNETEEEMKKREEEEKKAEKEKLEQGKQKYKEFSKVNPENAVVKNKLEVDAVKKKNNFIEATLGGPTAPFGVGLGDENLKHWKTMEKIPVRRFMDPEGSGWNVKGVQITLKDYQKPGLAMHEKLLPIFKQMEPMGYDFSKMTLNDFLMKAAEKGLLN